MVFEVPIRVCILRQSSITSILTFTPRVSLLRRIFRESANGHLCRFNSNSTSSNRTSYLRSKAWHRPALKRKIEDLVVPVDVPIPKFDGGEQPNLDGIVLPVSSEAKSMVLDEFRVKPMVRECAEENGLNDRLFIAAFRSFRNYCCNAQPLDPALSVTISDIIHGGQSVDSLFPFFLTHARKVFPHLECIEDLRMISDLTQPHNWYFEARKIIRKVIFHAGPTNSGKTFEAVQRFLNAESGVYCAPLRLLAAEVYQKMNDAGVRCDLVTGEERRYAEDQSHPSNHVACTVEMLATGIEYDVAVIDEIQMLRDEQRGWAWTRALLGVAAKELHLCGENAALDLVRELLDQTGEHVEVREYERKSKLTVSNHALRSLDNLQDGDCIICFSKANIFSLTRRLDLLGIKFAVIYGDLPPSTKLAQAAKFNDSNDPTKVLVATDAIGMGLNLNIRRIIFSTLQKNCEPLHNYHAIQIAGRAGRYGSQYEEGEVMTLYESDMADLKKLLALPIKPIKQAGIAPTFEQVETFAFHLREASFVNILNIFVSVCSVTDSFFVSSSVETMKNLAKLIEHVSLPLNVRYYLCIAPLDHDDNFHVQFFVKLARRFSFGQALDFEWLCDTIDWPPRHLERISDFLKLEQMYALLDAYLWLSFRFPEMMPAESEVVQLKAQLDSMIEDGLSRLVELCNKDNAKSEGLRKKIERKILTDEERIASEKSDKETEESASAVTDQTEKSEVLNSGSKVNKIPLRLSQKRKGKLFTFLGSCHWYGKKRFLSETLVAEGLLSPTQLEELKAELRKEMLLKMRSRK